MPIWMVWSLGFHTRRRGVKGESLALGLKEPYELDDLFDLFGSKGVAVVFDSVPGPDSFEALTVRLNDCSEVVLEPIRHLEMAPEPEKCLAIVRSKEESNGLSLGRLWS